MDLAPWLYFHPPDICNLRLQRLGVMIDANSVKIIAKAASIGEPGQLPGAGALVLLNPKRIIVAQ